MYRATGNSAGSLVAVGAIVEEILQRPVGPNSEIELVYRVLGEELTQTACYGANRIVAVESRIAKRAASNRKKGESQREVSRKQATRRKRDEERRRLAVRIVIKLFAPRDALRYKVHRCVTRCEAIGAKIATRRSVYAEVRVCGRAQSATRGGARAELEVQLRTGCPNEGYKARALAHGDLHLRGRRTGTNHDHE